MTQPYYHVGMAVQDLDAAMLEIGTALALTWARVQEMTVDGYAIRFTYSVEGPPHVELVEGPAGSAWDSTGGSQLHHVGVFSGDLPGDRARLEAAGLQVELAGRGFAYLQGGAGLRVELVDERARPAYERWFAGGDFR